MDRPAPAHGRSWLAPWQEEGARRAVDGHLHVSSEQLLEWLRLALAELDDRRATRATGGPEPTGGPWRNVGGTEGPPPDETIPAAELARRARTGEGHPSEVAP